MEESCVDREEKEGGKEGSALSQDNSLDQDREKENMRRQMKRTE